MTSRRFTLKAKFVAVLTALFTMAGLAPAAQAAPSNVVLIGDSIMANPYFDFADKIQGPGKVSRLAPFDGGCPKGSKRIAVSLQNQIGRPVDDFACNGAVVYSRESVEKRLSTLVDRALRSGKLTRSTTNVVLQVGINDTLKGLDLYENQKRNYVNSAKRQVARIRAAAPNAKISFAGYPAIAGEYGMSCWVHFNGVSFPPVPVFPIRNMLNAVHDWQRSAARATGASFIDIERPTWNHGTCAPRNQRWIAGLIDNDTKPYNMTAHLTHEGSDKVAGIIARAL
ncbi:GDSL-type esterase/lipase family protein [Corynebacterium urogenitale]